MYYQILNASAPVHGTRKVKSPGAPYSRSLAAIPGGPGILGIVVFSVRGSLTTKGAVGAGRQDRHPGRRGTRRMHTRRACPHAAHSSIAHGHVVTRAGDTYSSTCPAQHVASPLCSLSAHRATAGQARRRSLFLP